jgi:peptide chain release factor 3
LEKGVHQLTEEGVAQLFIQQPGNRKIIGTVGELQFEVIQFRLEHEYKAKASFAPLNYYKACWITSDDKKKLEYFMERKSTYIAFDKEENPVFFAQSEWALKIAQSDFPGIVFHFTSEFKTDIRKVVES